MSREKHLRETRPDTRPIRSRCWWAGAVMRVGRGSMWVGGGCIDARQELWWSEIRFSVDFASSKFSLSGQTHRQMDQGTHPLKITKIRAVYKLVGIELRVLFKTGYRILCLPIMIDTFSAIKVTITALPLKRMSSITVDKKLICILRSIMIFWIRAQIVIWTITNHSWMSKNIIF